MLRDTPDVLRKPLRGVRSINLGSSRQALSYYLWRSVVAACVDERYLTSTRGCQQLNDEIKIARSVSNDNARLFATPAICFVSRSHDNEVYCLKGGDFDYSTTLLALVARTSSLTGRHDL